MTRWRVLLARCREWWRRRQVEADLDEELSHHLDLLTDEFVRRGSTRDEARRLARREFGGTMRTKELVRDHRGLFMIETLSQDLRHAVRALAKARGFTVVAVLTLALGFGVNTAIFSLVDAVMLRPLPYPDADRLVSVWETHINQGPASEHSQGLAIGGEQDPNRVVVAPANLVDYRRSVPEFARAAGVARVAMNLTGGAPERLAGESVTYEYFDVLGAAPELGRVFDASEDRAGANHVVLLSDGLWRRRFGGDAGVIGRRIRLDNDDYEVIGVLGPDFQPATGFVGSDAVAFWVPAAYPADLLASRGDHEVNVIARLAPGATTATAIAQLQAVAAELARRFPATNGGLSAALRPLREDLVRNVRASLVVLLGAVGLIVLIACVNVANLLIIRAAAKRHDIAVRFALGASRARVLAELLTQSLVLATLGAAAGIALGAWTRGVLVHAAPASIPRLGAAAIDGRVLAFTAVVALVTTVFFGLVPAWQVGRSRPIEAIRTRTRSVIDTGVLRWRGALLTGEIALSTVLLVAAGLMLRSFATLNAVPLGFTPQHVLAMNIGLPELRYRTADDRFAFFDALAARVAAEPGVRSVAFANRLPMRGGWSSGILIEGDNPAAQPGPPDAAFQAVSPGYFHTLGIPLTRGRLLTAGDGKDSAAVAVVSEDFVREYELGPDPIGRRFSRGQGLPPITIVGVVADVRRGGLAAPIQPQVYLAAAQTTIYPVRLADFAVQATGDPVALARTVQADVWALDRDLPTTNVHTLDEVLWQDVANQRFETMLFGMFAALALVLAIVGVYGVVAYAVTQRIPEIGVRMSLGASRSRILGWVVGQSLWLVAIGGAIGLAGAAGLSQSLASLLFEVRPTDPLSYLGAAGLLGFAAVTATLIAGRAATRVDPVQALREA